tara:strand:+ start:823 stop:1071 length:249 start_codon:yes stop_codon:yes gene_type:complete
MNITLAPSMLNQYPITVNTIEKTVEMGGKTFTREEMKEYVDAYKGANRIHKPILVLFYTDALNQSFAKLQENWGADHITSNK